MLEVRNLSVRYGQHQALDSVSLNSEASEIVVILGANGAGKSTLLKAIGGMLPASGQVSINGKPVHGLPAHKIVEAGLALVPEGRGIFGELSVQENLMLGAYAQRARKDEAGNLDRVFSLFPRLTERRNQLANTMSGGEQQMVAIGRAMMSAPDVLMLDEPSLGLSPLLCRDLFRSLEAIRSTGTSVLLVEQNARQSLAIADRAYLLENGHIVGEGSAQELARDPAVQRAYLGGAASSPTSSINAMPATSKPAMAPRPGVDKTTRDGAIAANTHSLDDVINRALRAADQGNPAAASGDNSTVDSASIQTLVDQAERIQNAHIDLTRNDGADNHIANGSLPANKLANVIAQIESAAAAARGTSTRRTPRVHVIRPPGKGIDTPSAAIPVRRSSNAAADRADPHASAPAATPRVQAWRRSGVRIYRRLRPDGPLEKIDDIQQR